MANRSKVEKRRTMKLLFKLSAKTVTVIMYEPVVEELFRLLGFSTETSEDDVCCGVLSCDNFQLEYNVGTGVATVVKSSNGP